MINSVFVQITQICAGTKMDYEKTRLTPINEDSALPSDAAKAAAREQLRRARAETERYKQKYFEYYDDVKINHREDW